MSKLPELKCESCRGDMPPLDDAEVEPLLAELPGWSLLREENEDKLVKSFSFKNFRQALAFTNTVGETAEAEQHHPLLVTEWGKVTVKWWTHKIQGLHRNDFIMAARTDQLYAGR